MAQRIKSFESKERPHPVLVLFRINSDVPGILQCFRFTFIFIACSTWPFYPKWLTEAKGQSYLHWAVGACSRTPGAALWCRDLKSWSDAKQSDTLNTELPMSTNLSTSYSLFLVATVPMTILFWGIAIVKVFCHFDDIMNSSLFLHSLNAYSTKGSGHRYAPESIGLVLQPICCKLLSRTFTLKAFFQSLILIGTVSSSRKNMFGVQGQ